MVYFFDNKLYYEMFEYIASLNCLILSYNNDDNDYSWK